MFRIPRDWWQITLFAAATAAWSGTAQAHQMLYDQDGYKLAVGIEAGLGGFLVVTHRLRRPAMDETGAELIVSGTAPSAQRSGFAWCEKPVC